MDKCVEVEAEEDAPPDARAEEDTPLDEAEEYTGVRQTSRYQESATLQENAPLECKKIHAGEIQCYPNTVYTPREATCHNHSQPSHCSERHLHML